MESLGFGYNAGIPDGWQHFPDCSGPACDCSARHAQAEAFGHDRVEIT